MQWVQFENQTAGSSPKVGKGNFGGEILLCKTRRRKAKPSPVLTKILRFIFLKRPCNPNHYGLDARSYLFDNREQLSPTLRAFCFSTFVS